MRIDTHLMAFILVGALASCTLGEDVGLYDLPDSTSLALSDAGYPELLTEAQIATRGIAPLDPDARAAQLAAADTLGQQAGDLLQRESDMLQQRAGRLRTNADGLPEATPGLTRAGRNLLGRAAALRERARQLAQTG